MLRVRGKHKALLFPLGRAGLGYGSPPGIGELGGEGVDKRFGICCIIERIIVGELIPSRCDWNRVSVAQCGAQERDALIGGVLQRGDTRVQRRIRICLCQPQPIEELVLCFERRTGKLDIALVLQCGDVLSVEFEADCRDDVDGLRRN